MFLRFRKSGRRLYVSLIRSRRVDGKPRHEHIAALGSYAFSGRDLNAGSLQEYSKPIDDRRAIWPAFFEHTGDLSAPEQNRLTTAMQAHVPLPSEEELGGMTLVAAERTAAFCESGREYNLKQIKRYEGIIAAAQRNIDECREDAKKQGELAEQAKTIAARQGNYRGVIKTDRDDSD